MRRRRFSAVWNLHAARVAAGGAALVASLLMAGAPANAAAPVVAGGGATATAATTHSASRLSQPATMVPGASSAPTVRTQKAPSVAVYHGGEEYVVSDTDVCSTGFAVTSVTGQAGFVSAGHCGVAGSAVQAANGKAMGTVVASRFPVADYSWVATNAGFVGTPMVSRHNGSFTAVQGARPAGVGATVCMSGRASGWHCGKITATNQTVSYDQGTVSGLTQTTVCTDAGDSGGAFISGTQAQGVVSGGVGDCASGDGTYFQPLAPVLQTYGLRLRTS